MYDFDEVYSADPEIAAAIQKEVARQNDNIELIMYCFCSLTLRSQRL